MIRVNLLPSSRKTVAAAAAPASAEVGSTQLWAAVYGGATVLWLLALIGVYVVFTGRLEEQKAQNDRLSEEIAALDEKSAQLDTLKAELEKSRQLEAVVEELNAARLGPTRVLMELSKILSVDGGPTVDPDELERIRQENPLAGMNKGWDVRRLWLTSFEEADRSVRMTGLGRTNEDVAEFLQRLSLSELFDGVTLEKTEAEVDDDTGLSFIEFTLTAKVTY